MVEAYAYRFVALRYEKTREEMETEETEQYQLFETSRYKYRVFVTDMTDPIYFVVWFYNQRGGAENPIKEANNDAGLAAHPAGRFDGNGNHFQLAMPAYNLNCCRPQAARSASACPGITVDTTVCGRMLRTMVTTNKAWPVCFVWPAVQPRTAGRRHRTAPHDFGHFAITFSVRGG
jgi:hypothetical protein